MNCIIKLTQTICLFSFLFVAAITPETAHSLPIPSENDVLKTFGSPSQSSLSKRIKILVWNLHKGEDETFSTDFMDLAYKRDLIMGQEMLLNSVMTLVFGNFPHYMFSSATSFFVGNELSRTGVTTASPVAPEEIKFVKTLSTEPIVNSPKVTLISRYPLKFSNKILTVVNIHGINFVSNSAYRAEMTRIYEAIKNYPTPIIFAGDFNSWNQERNAILTDIQTRLKLRAARFVPDHRMTFNKYPLDHFFHTGDLKVIEAKVEDFYQGSDHKPLEVTVEYNGTESSPGLRVAGPP